MRVSGCNCQACEGPKGDDLMLPQSAVLCSCAVGFAEDGGGGGEEEVRLTSGGVPLAHLFLCNQWINADTRPSRPGKWIPRGPAACACLSSFGGTKLQMCNRIPTLLLPIFLSFYLCRSVTLTVCLPVFLPSFLQPMFSLRLSSNSVNHGGIIQLSSFGGCCVLFWNRACFERFFPSATCRQIHEWIMNFHVALLNLPRAQTY